MLEVVVVVDELPPRWATTTMPSTTARRATTLPRAISTRLRIASRSVSTTASSAPARSANAPSSPEGASQGGPYPPPVLLGSACAVCGASGAVVCSPCAAVPQAGARAAPAARARRVERAAPVRRGRPRPRHRPEEPSAPRPRGVAGRPPGRPRPRAADLGRHVGPDRRGPAPARAGSTRPSCWPEPWPAAGSCPARGCSSASRDLPRPAAGPPTDGSTPASGPPGGCRNGSSSSTTWPPRGPRWSRPPGPCGRPGPWTSGRWSVPERLLGRGGSLGPPTEPGGPQRVDITVSARHIDISPALRAAAEEKLGRLSRFGAEIERVGGALRRGAQPPDRAAGGL